MPQFCWVAKHTSTTSNQRTSQLKANPIQEKLAENGQNRTLLLTIFFSGIFVGWVMTSVIWRSIFFMSYLFLLFFLNFRGLYCGPTSLVFVQHLYYYNMFSNLTQPNPTELDPTQPNPTQQNWANGKHPIGRLMSTSHKHHKLMTSEQRGEVSTIKDYSVGRNWRPCKLETRFARNYKPPHVRQILIDYTDMI